MLTTRPPKPSTIEVTDSASFENHRRQFSRQNINVLSNRVVRLKLRGNYPAWQSEHCIPMQWRTGGGGGLGFQPPPPPKFRRPSKIVPNSTRL